MTDAQQLYRNERYKFDSKVREDDEFAEHAARVRVVQEHLARDHFGGVRKRVFHTKTHACLLGQLTLRPDRPAQVRRGVFADGTKQSYNVLVRFSNGVGLNAHDIEPDVRGFALKIFGVVDSSDPATAPRPKCVDWLMTNAPNPFGRDQDEFVQFMEANAASKLHLVSFLATHPEVARLLLKATARVVPSLATEQYWSGHSYLLGSETAMKFNVTPVAHPSVGIAEDRKEADRLDSLARRVVDGIDNIAERLERWVKATTSEGSVLRRDYLRRDLLHCLSSGPLRFTLSVQLERSPENTPIENTLSEWKESDSPSIPVADVELFEECTAIDADNLRFTPAHFIAAHRPLGNLARGRLFTYAASQDGRTAAIADPDERLLFQEPPPR